MEFPVLGPLTKKALMPVAVFILATTRVFLCLVTLLLVPWMVGNDRSQRGNILFRNLYMVVLISTK